MEHTSVAPATKVASRPNASPPIQKKGELQNSLVLGRQAADLVEVLLVCEQPGVCVYHSLGAAGGAGGVHDGHRIGTVDVVLHRLEQRGVDAVGKPLHPPGVDSDVAQLRGGGDEQPVIGVELRPRKRVGQTPDVIVRPERRGGQKDFDVAVDQLLAQFAGGDEGGEGDHHRTDTGRRQHADGEFAAVRVEQSHMSALAGTVRDQPAGQHRRAPIGVGVTDAVVVANQKWVVSP